MGGVGGKISFLKAYKIFSQYTQIEYVITAWEETAESTLKVLEKTPTKNLRLKIETGAKSYEFFPICQHKTE